MMLQRINRPPISALILRGLDALTTEETIVAALAKVTAHTVKNMKVVVVVAAATQQHHTKYIIIKHNTL